MYFSEFQFSVHIKLYNYVIYYIIENDNYDPPVKGTVCQYQSHAITYYFTGCEIIMERKGGFG